MPDELHYHDEASGLTLILGDARRSPALWQAFLDGARRRYQLHGIENMVAASDAAIARGIERFSAIVRDGQVVAGLRMRGPLTEADLPICRELDAFPASEIVHAKIRARLGEGVLEGKTAWVEKGFDGDGAALTRQLVAGSYMQLAATGCRWSVGTVSPFSLPLFADNGGIVDEDVGAVPFPSDELLTSVVWYDQTLVKDLIAGFALHEERV